jgi:hypothetical protein
MLHQLSLQQKSSHSGQWELSLSITVAAKRAATYPSLAAATTLRPLCLIPFHPAAMNGRLLSGSRHTLAVFLPSKPPQPPQ